MRYRIEAQDEHHDVHLHEVDRADLDIVAQHCADMRSHGYEGSKDMKLAASVPAFFVQQYLNTNGVTFAEFMRDKAHVDRFLADPALTHFRVWQGRI